MRAFKIGDRVRVVRRVADQQADGMGVGLRWHNSWNELEMTPYITEAKVWTIGEINDAGAFFAENTRFGWPLRALAHAKTKKVI